MFPTLPPPSSLSLQAGRQLGQMSGIRLLPTEAASPINSGLGTQFMGYNSSNRSVCDAAEDVGKVGLRIETLHVGGRSRLWRGREFRRRYGIPKSQCNHPRDRLPRSLTFSLLCPLRLRPLFGGIFG